MACEFICDGCGKREPADIVNGEYDKPWNWFGRRYKDGPQVACSRACIEKIAAATGKTAVVLPIEPSASNEGAKTDIPTRREVGRE